MQHHLFSFERMSYNNTSFEGCHVTQVPSQITNIVKNLLNQQTNSSECALPPNIWNITSQFAAKINITPQ